LTLTEFLLARIAEDEHAARGARPLSELSGWVAVGGEDVDRAERHFRRWEAARVLAECEAKRRIVAHLASGPVYVGTFGSAVPSTSDFVPGTPGASESASYVLALLALPYADHSDYDEAWRPAP
jgi:hypothetical protein